MSETIEAIYEDGVLKLPRPLPLPEKTHVLLRIQGPVASNEGERKAWLKLSQDALLKTWNNAEDDVFNELLQK